jgi:class 3 adenylate cyclase
MLDTANRTFICSVVFIDLVGYSKKPVTEQIRLKTSLTNNLSEAIKDIPTNDRIILDTGDGAAISFLGDPEDALFVTLSLREAMMREGMTATIVEATGEDAVRMGINLGPVKLVKDINGHPNIIGDGINVAQRIMSFARPGQIVVSRSYYDVVSNLASEYAKLFSYEGSRTDKHVREHEVYSVVGETPAARRVAESALEITGDASNLHNWLAGTGPLGLRRSALAAAPALFFAVIGGAMAVSAMLEPRPVPASGASAAPAARTAERLPAGSKKQIVARIERKLTEKGQEKALADPGRLELAIAPWGKVFVDGQERGVSPPLRALDIPAGSHTIVIHNSNFPPHVERVVIKTGEATRIRHRFR